MHVYASRRVDLIYNHRCNHDGYMCIPETNCLGKYSCSYRCRKYKAQSRKHGKHVFHTYETFFDSSIPAIFPYQALSLLIPKKNRNMNNAPVIRPTHDVNPYHEVLQNGVRFNVQTVPSLGNPLELRTPEQTAKWVQRCAIKASQNVVDKEDTKDYGLPPRYPVAKIEQHSIVDNSLVVHRARSLMQICLTAFAHHYPLTLSPDHIWLAIAYGAAKHIDKNAEALRSRFVSFKSKKQLDIQKHDANMGHIPVREWESDVFHEFSTQIRKHIGNEIHQLFAAPFSTTSKAEMAAAEITLMSATAQYFSYMMMTMCGIPSIELEGKLDDWIEVRRRAGRLRDFLLPDFAQEWLTCLLPVLDEFVSAYKGNVNHAFWQRMVKVYESGMSGETPVLSGWINNLYPYLANDKVNRHMGSWIFTSQFHGPDPATFPDIVSSVALMWDYYGKEYPLHFHAGYFGMTQDKDTLALRPYIGWIVAHDQKKQNEKHPEA